MKLGNKDLFAEDNEDEDTEGQKTKRNVSKKQKICYQIRWTIRKMESI